MLDKRPDMNGLTDSQISRLLEFVGYGSLSAPVWFIGLEEAGEGEDRLLVRTTFDRIMDILKAHEQLELIDNFGEDAVQQRTWWNMCQVMLLLSGIPDPSSQDRLTYQTQRLGRREGETLLIEAMSVPNTSLNKWDYPNLLPNYANRKDFRNRYLPQRLGLILGLVSAQQPLVVITYGGNKKEPFRTLFRDWQIRPAPEFDWGTRDGTLLILSKHFMYRSRKRCQAIVDLIETHHPELKSRQT